mgnify:CR=1 FL=1
MMLNRNLLIKKVIFPAILLHILFFVPIFLSNAPFRGFVVNLTFFILLFFAYKIKIISHFVRLVIASFYLFALCLFLLQIYNSSGLVLDGFDNGIFWIFENHERYIYAFKNTNFLGYGANYIALIFVIFSFVRYKTVNLIIVFILGARAVIVAYIVYYVLNKKVRLNHIYLWSGFFLFIMFMYVSIDYSGIRALELRAHTVETLLSYLTGDCYSCILVGDGIESAADHSSVTGHTLYGNIAKTGVFPMLLSLLTYRLIVSRGRLSQAVDGGIFIVYFAALISMSALNFVMPLIFSIYIRDNLKND